MERAHAAERLIEAGRRLHTRGFSPATSGNYSARLDGTRILVTASGKHKGMLTPDDLVVVDYDGRPVDGGHPSAETPLHVAMFRADAGIGCVIHTHSVRSTVLGRLLARHTEIDLVGYEMVKAFAGVSSHTDRVTIPIFENSQEVPIMAERVRQRWMKEPFVGYLIVGHGLYAWGKDVDRALIAIEALEFLVSCEVESRMIGA
jgi:methylthioribulose-1-phosphate dehydratase